MPTFDIVKKNSPQKTYNVAAVMDKFSIEDNNLNEHFKGSLDIEDRDWQIGVIYGNSGTGKSTIAKHLFGNSYFYSNDWGSNSVIDDLPGSISDITNTLNSVGFSSPPSWLKPYSVLSGGEKMRVDLAKALLSSNELIVFDEFTSVVDRNVARIGSFALQKSIRRNNKKKFIAVSCHEDIIDWLDPDWVFCTNDMSFFLAEKTPGQKLRYQSEKSLETIGEVLGNIII